MALHNQNKRESLGRELSEAVPSQRENYKKLNAIKRISRNSIVLFSFAGRNKKEKIEKSTKKDEGTAEQMRPSASSKQLKEPQIGKLDLIQPQSGLAKKQNYIGTGGNVTPSTSQQITLKSEEPLENLQLIIDSATRENEDLKFSLQLNKESLQSMMLESQRSATKEASLIETINIISKDNGLLKEQIDSLKSRISYRQKTQVSFRHRNSISLKSFYSVSIGKPRGSSELSDARS